MHPCGLPYTAICSKAQHRQLTSVDITSALEKGGNKLNLPPWSGGKLGLSHYGTPGSHDSLAFRTDLSHLVSYHWDPLLPLEHWRFLDMSWCHFDILIVIATFIYDTQNVTPIERYSARVKQKNWTPLSFLRFEAIRPDLQVWMYITLELIWCYRYWSLDNAMLRNQV